MFRRLATVLSLALLLPAAGSCPADDVSLAPQEGVLLLRSGGVLSGRITRVGMYYDLARDAGEMRVPAESVELVARDLHDLYGQMRKAIDVQDAAARLDLAEWCLRQDLMGYAAAELHSARAANPGHPRIELLERRLRMAVTPPPSRQTAPGLAEEQREAQSPGNPEALPDDDHRDLEQLARSLPPGAIEQFTEKIQPLLLNRCAGAGCHGPGAEGDWELERIPSGRPPSFRTTHRNLAAVLEMVNRDDPSASQLLSEPIRPHGTARQAIFTEHDLAQYRQLVGWVQRVGNGATRDFPVRQASFEEDSGARRGSPTPPLHRPQVSEAERTAETFGREGAGSGDPPKAPDVGDAKSQAAQQKLDSAKSEPPVIRDPFDPAVFNRRYNTTSPEASAERK